MKSSQMFIVSIVTCVIQVFAAPATRPDDNFDRAYKFMPEEIKEDFPSLLEVTKKLTDLYAKGTPMKVTADVFSAANHLEMIDLSYSGVREIEDRAFYEASKLKKMNLSGNKLKTLPSDLFAQRNSIKEMDLSDNQIQELSRATFSNLQEMKKLDLSNNKLTVLDKPIFVDMINLKELDLTGNPIRSMSESFFGSLPKGLELSFDDESLDYKSSVLVEQWAL